MPPVALPYSPEDLQRIVALLRAKPGVLATAFSKNERAFPDEMGLTDGDVDLLLEGGLMDDAHGLARPKFRLQRERAGVLVTRDFPRRERDVAEPEPNKPGERVFPWADEAGQLHDYVIERVRADGAVPDRVLNMCCGSGALALSLTREWADQGHDHVRALGVDIEPRAVERSEYNRQLNEFDGHPATGQIKFRQGDLCQCEAIQDHHQYGLIVAAPPYSLHPREHTASGRHGGGELGIAVVEPLLRQCGRHLAPGGRLVCQCYSVGDDKNPTLLEQVVADTFGLSPDAARAAVVQRNDLKVWRFRDEKCFNAPMPLEYMVVRCSDPTYPFYKEFQAAPEKRMAEYVAWIEGIKKQKSRHGDNYSHLHYVIVDYRRPDK